MNGLINIKKQGYAGTGVLNNIRVSNDAKDPLENSHYTYTTNIEKTKFQLLALLENNNTNTSYNIIPETYANYGDRNIYIIGDQLGTLLEPTTKIPIQELGNNINLLVDTTTEYLPVFNKSNELINYSGGQLEEQLIIHGTNNGICGNDYGMDLTNIPVNLCKKGEASSVIDNGVDSTYECTCSGISGGSTISCSANHVRDFFTNNDLSISCPANAKIGYRCSGGVVFDTANKLVISEYEVGPDTPSSIHNASECNSIPVEGFTDWSMPTWDHWDSIIQNKNIIGTFQERYDSSSDFDFYNAAGNCGSNHFNYFRFYDGYKWCISKWTSTSYTRCVRGY